MRFVCSPTPKSALPCATRSSDSSGVVGTRMDSASPSSRKNPFSFAATSGRWSGFRNHSSATVTICVLFLPIYFIRGRVIHNGWGGAERDPGGAQRLAWFMAGQPRRRCDLLRFAEHPRCAGRSAEREHVRVARRQAPHPIEFHTGHDSSFHAISQNIHSYRELLINLCSRRTFSPSVACFAHVSTFPGIHSPTSANSGEAYSNSQSR